jgi:hypothetical protein
MNTQTVQNVDQARKAAQINQVATVLANQNMAYICGCQ